MAVNSTSKLDPLFFNERIGLTLTESFAMLLAAAVSYLYFTNPQSQYYMVSKINKDQVKGMSLDETEKWLSLNLGY